MKELTKPLTRLRTLHQYPKVTPTYPNKLQHVKLSSENQQRKFRYTDKQW